MKKQNTKAYQKQQEQLKKQQDRQEKRNLRNKNKKNRSQAKASKGIINFQLGYNKHFMEFNEELNQFGLFIRDVDGDGNCLFRAIADQMEGNERQHKFYRRQAVDALKERKDFFSLFMDEEMTFDDYVDQMSQDGEWGGNMELQALVESLEVNFFIHMKGRPVMVMKSDEYMGTNEQLFKERKNIHLAYHLIANVAEHYSSVRMLGDEKYEQAQPIPLEILGINNDIQSFKGYDEVDNIDLDGAEFETEEEREYMYEYARQLQAEKEAEQNFQQKQQKDEPKQLKQKKNARCNCGSKKTYKDCCMQKDLLNDQEKKEPPKQQQEQQKKQVVYI